MTDKEKIREEVEKLKSNLVYGACSSQVAMETRCKEEAYNEVLAILDSMQEEPVSGLDNGNMPVERWKQAVKAASNQRNYRSSKGLTETRDDYFVDGVQWADEHPKKEPVSEELEEASKEWLRPQLDKSYADYGEAKMMELTHFDGYAMLDAIEFGAQWQQEKDSISAKYLDELINKLSKQFPEVSFAKLSRIAVRVVKWQKEQFEKNRLKHCDSITNEQAELEQGFIDQHLDKHQRMPTFLDAIEYGMRLQKEQDIKHGYVTFLQGEKHFANYILEMINSGWHIVAIKTACNDKIKED